MTLQPLCGGWEETDKCEYDGNMRLSFIEGRGLKQTQIKKQRNRINLDVFVEEQVRQWSLCKSTVQR